ncbi:MAG: 3-deoxy-manno-octulosonate cytidylyltransferase [Melioribacteraceae bacterium]|jgi:3-deoxy-manno-octulosonate cytidylyltransferase (CMP-KDO synthetase)|nr:3-deoxy-manno-octulosonate cytidylyltransferase [Melioribacteraceae bacterium]
MNFLGIIPARFGSTRLEGKPLADICGKPMIQHVYERVNKVINDVYVATDDIRIEEVVKSFGGNVVMTSEKHNSGTNRCLEAHKIIQENSETEFEVVLNIQGDEPMLASDQILELMSCFDNPKTEIATLVTKVNEAEDLNSKTSAFVIYDVNMRAIYFSRTPIPAVKGLNKNEWFGKSDFYKHIGMYAYRPNVLEIIANLSQSKLELIEGLEQNRWIENGYPIHVAITEFDSISVDTQEDLENIKKIMCK